MTERPWVAGLLRLLRERPTLQKGELAEYGRFRPGNISAILKAPAGDKKWPKPDLETLETLAAAFTRYDRRPNGGDPDAPEVQLYEFFVTDDQAAVLRAKDAQQRALVSPPPPTEDAKLLEQFARFKRWQEAEAAADAATGSEPAPKSDRKRSA